MSMKCYDPNNYLSLTQRQDSGLFGPKEEEPTRDTKLRNEKVFN